MTDALRLAGELNAYDDAPEGTQLARFQTGVDRRRQAHYHACTGIASEAFGEVADVTILAQDNSRATTRAGLPNDGRVHIRHVIRQRGRVRLGEELVINGRIGPYRQTRRGKLLTCLFGFLRGDASVPLEMETEYLLPFAAPPAARPAAERAARPADADPLAGMTLTGELVLTPERVTGYSSEVGNRIHFDPEFAKAAGYEAPLAQGLMELTALHGALVQEFGPPEQIDLEVRFLRPVTWEAALEIVRDAEARTWRCVGADGRVTAEMTVSRLQLRP
ncbi:MAG TPA: MaoC family dehydratase [Alphaproteobacteria bacterium]|nr:MaoC family dehydratase [Alphaproteobacteria bacterium]